MTGSLRYSEEALGHIDKLSDFLVRQAGVETSLRIIDELLDAFDKLEEMPYIGREHPDPLLASRGYRVYSSGNYVGVYLATDEGVWVAGVYHTRTDWLAQPSATYL